ncbi:MAG: hypothetical protein ACQESH_06550 [Campylobacterota bacterium]
MDEIIQKLKTFYNQRGVFFQKLQEATEGAKECYLDVNGDDSGLQSYRNNYSAITQKIAQELGCQTKGRYDVLDGAFDLEFEEEAIKVVYAHNQLDLYEI